MAQSIQTQPVVRKAFNPLCFSFCDSANNNRKTEQLSTHCTFSPPVSSQPILNRWFFFYIRMYQCATISELHLPKTCFASGTERSLLCVEFLYHWFSQGQSGSRVLLHKGTLAKTFIRPTKHLVCLHCISALPKLYRRTCKSNITNV